MLIIAMRGSEWALNGLTSRDSARLTTKAAMSRITMIINQWLPQASRVIVVKGRNAHFGLPAADMPSGVDGYDWSQKLDRVTSGWLCAPSMRSYTDAHSNGNSVHRAGC